MLSFKRSAIPPTTKVRGLPCGFHVNAFPFFYARFTSTIFPSFTVKVGGSSVPLSAMIASTAAGATLTLSATEVGTLRSPSYGH
jgi:hypothetical protein